MNISHSNLINGWSIKSFSATQQILLNSCLSKINLLWERGGGSPGHAPIEQGLSGLKKGTYVHLHV